MIPSFEKHWLRALVDGDRKKMASHEALAIKTERNRCLRIVNEAMQDVTGDEYRRLLKIGFKIGGGK